MNRYNRHILTVVFGIFCWLVSAQTKGVDRSNHSLLWEISGNGLTSPSYLFGTFHNNALELFDQPDSVFYALHQANAVALEVDLTAMMGQIDVAQNRANSLPGNLRWMVKDPNNITYTQYGSDEGRPQFLDMYFNQVADQCEKTFLPLETLEQQMAISLSFGRKRTGIQPSKAISLLDMKQLYLEGDIGKLHDVTMESCLPFEGLYEDLLVNRNRLMADGLDTLMHQYHLFCAVGAAHLGGPHGIITILQSRGYQMRRVVPSFSDNRLQYLDEIKKCEGYAHVDSLYGFRISLEGKPRQIIDKDGSHNLIYQELGQGNLFTVYSYQMESLYPLKEVWDNAMLNTAIATTAQFEKLRLYDGTPAYQALVKDVDNDQFWLRMFTRNGIVYIMHATGGTRFLNSSRAERFFNRFVFLDAKDHQPINVNVETLSPTGSLKAKMPQYTLEMEDGDREMRFWRQKYFDALTGESFFIYESILQNDYLYYTDDNFGNHLVEEFHVDSIEFFAFVDLPIYSEKQFKAKRHGQTYVGKIRQIGNILHYGQYSGTDSARAQLFLSSMEFVPFEAPKELVTVSKNDFKTRTTTSGFKKIDNLEDYSYRKSKHYTLNDIPQAITYEVLIKNYEPWAFIDEELDSILFLQIIWPDSSKVKNSSSFNYYTLDSTRFMDFEIHYLEAKNIWKGKICLSDRSMRLISMTFPFAAYEQYATLPFLDSTIFVENSASRIQQVNLDALQKKINGTPLDREQVKEFFVDGQITSGTAWRLLNQLEQLGTKRTDSDRRNSLRSELFARLNDSIDVQEVFKFWKKYLTEEGNGFALTGLVLFAQNDSSLLTEAAQLLSMYEKYPQTSYKLSDMITLYPERFIPVWEYISTLYMQSDMPSSFMDILEELITHPFYANFSHSEIFLQYCVRDPNQEWLVIRYMELLMKSNAEPSFLYRLNEFLPPHSPYEVGIKLALNESFGKKLTKKNKKRLQDDVFLAIGYAAASNLFRIAEKRNVFLNKGLSHVQELGLLAYYYYLDEVEEKNHALKLLFNVAILVESNPQMFCIYQAKENGSTYYFARLVTTPPAFPFLMDYGSDTYFLQIKEDVTEERVRQELITLLNE